MGDEKSRQHQFNNNNLLNNQPAVLVLKGSRVFQSIAGFKTDGVMRASSSSTTLVGQEPDNYHRHHQLEQIDLPPCVKRLSAVNTRDNPGGTHAYKVRYCRCETGSV